jgi:hypothetical protein
VHPQRSFSAPCRPREWPPSGRPYASCRPTRECHDGEAPPTLTIGEADVHLKNIASAAFTTWCRCADCTWSGFKCSHLRRIGAWLALAVRQRLSILKARFRRIVSRPTTRLPERRRKSQICQLTERRMQQSRKAPSPLDEHPLRMGSSHESPPGRGKPPFRSPQRRRTADRPAPHA